MTGINLRRPSNTNFYCKSELNFIPYKDLTDLTWNNSIYVGSRLSRQLYSVLNCPANQKMYPIIWDKSPVLKIRLIISSLPLVTVRIIDQGPPVPTGKLLSCLPVWSPLLQDWTVSDLSAFPCRLSFHNSWQPFALLWVSSSFNS